MAIAVALAATGCGPDLPEFQRVQVSPMAGIEPFVGSWYDYVGNRWVLITGGRSPQVEIRLGPRGRLSGARVDGVRIVLDLADRDLQLALTLSESGGLGRSVVGYPSSCGTCSPTYHRSYSRRLALERHMAHALAEARQLQDRAMGALIQAF